MTHMSYFEKNVRHIKSYDLYDTYNMPYIPANKKLQ